MGWQHFCGNLNERRTGDTMEFDDRFMMNMMIKMFNGLFHSPNPIVNPCASSALNGSQLFVSNSISHISVLTNTACHEIPFLRINEKAYRNDEVSLILDLFENAL